jgi:hypothetical protein
MIKEVKKLYKDCIDIRDYEVNEAIQKEESIKVKYDGDYMTLSPSDLLSKKKRVSNLMKSKVGGKDYFLFSYEWIPDDVEL